MHPIQKSQPIPKKKRSLTGRKYPFEYMDVGDMFFVENKKQSTLYTQAWVTGKRIGAKFATRTLHMKLVDDAWEECNPAEEGATLGVGVWRVE